MPPSNIADEKLATGNKNNALIFLCGLGIGLGHVGRSLGCCAERLGFEGRQVDSHGLRQTGREGRGRDERAAIRRYIPMG